MRKVKIGMFWRIVMAILGGVALGFAFVHLGDVGEIGLRMMKTFNVIFAQVLKFIVPLLILGLVTPSIADAGKGAGKLLLTVMVFSYLSTCAASLFGYFAAGQLLPQYVEKGAAAAGKGAEILPYVDLKIPLLCDVLTALALSFMIGVESILGLSPEQVAVMMTFYMALDGYGPAANVTGDGAIALACERLFSRKEAR